MMEVERLAVLENEVGNIKGTVADIKSIVIRSDEKSTQKFEALSNTVATKTDLKDETARNKTDLKDVNDRIDKEVLPQIKEIQNKKQLKENLLWIGLLASTITSVIMVYTLFNK